MTNPALEGVPRGQRRALISEERKRRQSGAWGEWEVLPFPSGIPGARGWNKEVRHVWRNKVFAVLIRPLQCGSIHLAVSSLTGDRPTFHEAQRLKNEILGSEATAVEVYPPASEMVDEADMFHFWSVDTLPFSIFDRAKHRAAIPARGLTVVEAKE